MGAGRRGWRRLVLAGLAVLVAAAVLMPQRTPAALATTLGYAKGFGGTTASDSAEGAGIAVDGSGNAQVVGTFVGTVDFDPNGGTANLSGTGGSQDGFIARLNASGNLVAGSNIRIDGSGADEGSSIAVGPAGISFVTGTFNDTTITGGRGQAYVVAVLADGSPGGTVLRFGGPGESFGNGIAVDGSGNIYLAGTFQGQIDFNPGAGLADLTASGFSDAFVVKLNNSGGFEWAKQIGGTSVDRGFGIAVDGNGDVYVTGQFDLTVVFGGGVPDLETNGFADAFVVKLNGANGNTIWAKGIGGSLGDVANGIVVDASGNVYVTGLFRETNVDFDPGAGVFPFDSAGATDAFAVKLTSNGDFVWAGRFGGTVSDQGNGIAVDAAGNVYLTGLFQGLNADFNPGAGVFPLDSAGGNDVFAVKLDATGALVWAERYGGPANDSGNGIVVDGFGNVYLTGSFQGTNVTFAPSNGGSTSLTSNTGAPSNNGAFVLKLAQTAPPVNGLPAAQQATADGTPLVFSAANGNRISVADADNGSTPPRVTLAVNSGTLTLATTAGLTFSNGSDGTADASMTFTGTLAAINTALNGLTFTPVAGGPITATLTMTTEDLLGPSGGQTDTDNLVIRSTRAPVAVNDSYPLSSSSGLSVPALTGVLANDTDQDTAKALLRAEVVTGPTRGSVTLQNDGSFTYTPRSSLDATDSFTYRVTDPDGRISATATVTLAITGVACGPRPSVTVTTQVVNGALQATVTANDLGPPTLNQIRRLDFGTFQNKNAVVTVNGQTVADNEQVTLPAGTTVQTFTVRRAAAGVATTVPLTVVDACGSWPTFVGGGTGAGF